MSFDIQQVRKRAWDTTFHRGFHAWLSLVVVCFFFAFIGASNSFQTSFVDGIDRLTGASDYLQPHNAEVLEAYIDDYPLPSELTDQQVSMLRHTVNSLTESASWVIRLLALNPRYFAANPGEVLANVLIVAIISILIRFAVLNVAMIGRHRFFMESRQQREVAWRRVGAPFYLATLRNLIWVMVCYHTTLLLWWLTIVGGIYKSYQYSMVPYLMAENPQLTWREARELSTRMTDGYKWQMFRTQLSCWYLFPLLFVPVVGLLVPTPVLTSLDTEFYFTLRSNPAFAKDEVAQKAFVERAFDGPSYAELSPEEQQVVDENMPVYVLQDLEIERPEVHEGFLPYPVVDLIYCFFIFCFIGWVWEVGLHFYQVHEFANRGTMNGPWIPIYGVGGTGVIVLLDRYKQNPEKLFCMTIGLCAVLEYATSFVLDFIFNSSYWNYDGMLLNVNGRICLAGLLAFGIGGMVGIYIAAPAISKKVRAMPENARNVGAAVLVCAFLSDFVYCAIHGFNSGEGVGEKL